MQQRPTGLKSLQPSAEESCTSANVMKLGWQFDYEPFYTHSCEESNKVYSLRLVLIHGSFPMDRSKLLHGIQVYNFFSNQLNLALNMLHTHKYAEQT